MRRAEREITSFSEIAELVGRCDTVRLGIAAEGAPYIVPVSFGWEICDGRIVIYFHGSREGRKQELIGENAMVCVEGDISHGFAEWGHGITCLYESFIGYGTVEKLSGEEAVRGLELLLVHCGYPGYPFTEEAVNATAVNRIVLETVTGKRQKS